MPKRCLKLCAQFIRFDWSQLEGSAWHSVAYGFCNYHDPERRTHVKHLHYYVRHITETHISHSPICHHVHTYVTMHAEHLAHPDVFLATGIYSVGKYRLLDQKLSCLFIPLLNLVSEFFCIYSTETQLAVLYREESVIQR